MNAKPVFFNPHVKYNDLWPPWEGLKNHSKNLKKSHNVQNVQPHHRRPWEHKFSKKVYIWTTRTCIKALWIEIWIKFYFHAWQLLLNLIIDGDEKYDCRFWISNCVISTEEYLCNQIDCLNILFHRNCIGQNFALNEEKTLISRILHRCVLMMICVAA